MTDVFLEASTGRMTLREMARIVARTRRGRAEIQQPCRVPRITAQFFKTGEAS